VRNPVCDFHRTVVSLLEDGECYLFHALLFWKTILLGPMLREWQCDNRKIRQVSFSSINAERYWVWRCYFGIFSILLPIPYIVLLLQLHNNTTSSISFSRFIILSYKNKYTIVSLLQLDHYHKGVKVETQYTQSFGILFDHRNRIDALETLLRCYILPIHYRHLFFLQYHHFL